MEFTLDLWLCVLALLHYALLPHFGAAVGLPLGLLYCLPTFCAAVQRPRFLLLIGALNLALGWFSLGYLGLLVWALWPRREGPASPPALDWEICVVIALVVYTVYVGAVALLVDNITTFFA